MTYLLLDRSGCHVLSRSFEQGWLFSIPEGGRKGPGNRELLRVTAPDVEIDLAGHSLSTNIWLDGIVAAPQRTDTRTPPSAAPARTLVVRNGSIQLLNSNQADPDRSGIGVTAPESAQWVHSRYIQNHPLPTRFPKSRIVLENLKIRTANAAALLMGEGVVIRNCSIEVDGENALIVYGPHALIEGNRITLRRKMPKNEGRPTYPVVPAAIYLRAADGATVRGNTIELEDDTDTMAGVAIVDSGDVLIESNRFNRDTAPVLRRGAASAQFRGNTVKEGRLREERRLPDVEVK